MKTSKTFKIIALVIIFSVLALAFCGCVPGAYTPNSPAGFFSGMRHGWMAPFSLILGIFTDIHIYESCNSGFFYDLGFYMAIISGFGGLALSRKAKKKK